MTQRRRHRRRGNMLVMALTLMLILVTLVASLHHYESISKRAAGDAEADLIAAQQRKWAIARVLNRLDGQTAPSTGVWYEVGAPKKVHSVIPAECGKDLYKGWQSGKWEGLPNLAVSRQDTAGMASVTGPPTTEYDLTPKSSNPLAQLPDHYKLVLTEMTPLAAYAPSGNITLESCVTWSNPPMGDGRDPKSAESYSGQPCVVAANAKIKIGKLLNGSAISNNSQGETDPVELGAGSTGLPQVAPLPVPRTSRGTIEASVLSQLAAACTNLTDTAQSLDDKTNQISGDPPDFLNIVKFLFVTCVSGDSQAIIDQLLGWMSVRSATDFPFVSIPGFATTSFPFCYIAFQFWFHGPHPPDLGVQAGASAGQSSNHEVIRALEKQTELMKARRQVQYLLLQLEGGEAMRTETRSNGSSQIPGAGTETNVGNVDLSEVWVGNSDPNSSASPVSTGLHVTAGTALPQVHEQINRGLRQRWGDYDNGYTIAGKIMHDYNILLSKHQAGVRTLVTSPDLWTDQSLLIWLADAKGYLFDDNGRQINTNVDHTVLFGTASIPLVPNVQYALEVPVDQCPANMKWVYENDELGNGYYSYNKTLESLTCKFEGLKNFKGDPVMVDGRNVRDTNKMPSQFMGPQHEREKWRLTPGQPLTHEMWSLMCQRRDGRAPGIEAQLKLMQWLAVGDEAQTIHPIHMMNRLRNTLHERKTDLQTAIDAVQLAIDNFRNGINNPLANDAKTSPGTRKEEGEAPFKDLPGFKDDKGILGWSYAKFGWSFEVMWYILDWLAKGPENNPMPPMWCASQPTVWFGRSDNEDGLITNPVLDIPHSTFTVPAGKTFYYNNPVVIRGDLWLQRGATMVVRGDLKVKIPSRKLGGKSVPLGLISDKTQFLSFLPYGRLLMEEGANLIVRHGNLCVEGPVFITGQPYEIHPISTSIMVPEGCAKLCLGTTGGFTLPEILMSKDIGQTGKDINKGLFAVLYEVFPNMGKIWPLGPFHRRKPFFARYATQYQFEVFIGPFGIPIPVMHPWPIPRDNVLVTLYKGLSTIYAITCNINLGENLYTESDWWLLKDPTSGTGMAPIVPKLDFTAMSVTGPDVGKMGESLARGLGSITFPDANQLITDATHLVKTMDPSNAEGALKLFAEKMLAGLVVRAILSMAPAPWNIALGEALGDKLTALIGGGDSGDDNSFGKMVAGRLQGPMQDLEKSWSDLGDSFENLREGLLREVAGTLVYADEIQVGFKANTAFTAIGNALGLGLSPLVGNKPPMAAGMFVAKRAVNIHADYTMGSIICAGTAGINQVEGCSTRLLFYPPYGRASLHVPSRAPKITREIRDATKGHLPNFLVRAFDVEYGPYIEATHAGIDIAYPAGHVALEGTTR